MGAPDVHGISFGISLPFPMAVKVIPASRVKLQRAGMDAANASDY
jgi:hypothetical protein